MSESTVDEIMARDAKLAALEPADDPSAFWTDHRFRHFPALVAEIERLRELQENTEAACKDGWAWVDEALAALGAKTVFDIKDKNLSLPAANAEVEALREGIRIATAEIQGLRTALDAANAEIEQWNQRVLALHRYADAANAERDLARRKWYEWKKRAQAANADAEALAEKARALKSLLDQDATIHWPGGSKAPQVQPFIDAARELDVALAAHEERLRDR